MNVGEPFVKRLQDESFRQGKRGLQRMKRAQDGRNCESLYTLELSELAIYFWSSRQGGQSVWFTTAKTSPVCNFRECMAGRRFF